MTRLSSLLLSNQLEILAGHLKADLLRLPPFQRRVIVVPSHAAKTYLLRLFAKELGIAAGMQVLTLHESVSLFPSYLELSLQIERQIRNVQDRGGIYKPLFEYIGDKQERLIKLSDQLSAVFSQYRICGGEALSAWEAKQGWQQELWNALSLFSHEKSNLKGPIFLFGFSYLPKIYWDIFKNLDAQFYLLSPCRMYWTDVCTDKERTYLSKKTQSEELDAYLRDSNPFLSHLGKAGRDFMKVLEEEEVVTEEHYADYGRGALAQVQQDILDLRASGEGSIKIHSAPTLLREIEVLYNELLQGSGQDVVVMAPNIEDYVPYIHMVFGSSESCLDYTISDLSVVSQSPFCRAFRHLLSLVKGNFEVSAVLKLFLCPVFLDKFSLSSEEASRIKEWVASAHVRWGMEGVHGWRQGLDRLIVGLATLTYIEMSEAELLGKLVSLIRSLNADLTPLREGSQLPLFEWARYLKCLAESYFVLSDEDEKWLRGLNVAVEGDFSYASVERILDHLFEKKTGTFQANHVNAVRFCSLNKGSAVPADTIWLLGMEEGAFPRTSNRSSLNEIPSPMSQTDEDRYLFLELILSARGSFNLSYQRLSSSDNKEQHPSLLVQELFKGIDICHHPSHAFDKRNFEKGAPCLPSQYLAAQSFYIQEKQEIAPLFSSFYTPTSLEVKKGDGEIFVEIKDLKKLARHPIEFYFHRVLKIYLQEEEQFTEEGEFALSHLEKAALRKASLKQPLEAVLHSASQGGRLPGGIFQDVAYNRVRDETEEFHDYLSSFGVRPEDIFSVEFKIGCKKQERVSPSLIIAPPLAIGKAFIIGKLDDLTPQGLLFHGEDDLSDLVRAWPLFLISQSITDETALLMTKSGKKLNYARGDALSRYIQYYETCLEHPSPLMPEWAPALLKGDTAALEKAMRNVYGGEDRYIDWLIKRGPPFSAQAIFDNWASFLGMVLNETV